MLFHLVPFDDGTGSVGAENRVRRVVQVAVRVVPDVGDDLFRVVAGPVALYLEEQAAIPSGVDADLPGVVPHGGDWGGAGEDRAVPQRFRPLKGSVHALDVSHSPADALAGHLQPEGVPGLQQDGFRLFQPLPQGAIGGLTEVAALCVLDVGATGEDADPHIGDGGTGQDTEVGFLRQMGENQPLPVGVQHVLAAQGVEYQSTARCAGLQQQVDLGVVAQGLEVSDPSTGAAMVSLYTMLPVLNSTARPNRSAISRLSTSSCTSPIS